MAKDQVFTSKKRRVLRNHIPLVENYSSVVVFFGLIGIVVWFLAQANNFNPGERDVTLEQLLEGSVTVKMVNPPFKPWSETETSGRPSYSEPLSLGLFSPQILDQGWKVSSRLKIFTADNLYEKINGEAEKFLKQGFKALHYIAIKVDQSEGSPSELSIELYDQGNLGGSSGIFSDHLSKEKKLEQQGSVVYFKTSVGVIGRKGRFFFRVAGNQESLAITQKSQQLIELFALLEEEGSESVFELDLLVNKMNIPSSQTTFQKQNVFQYDFVNEFWFGQINLEKSVRLFLHKGPSSEESQTIYNEILEEHSYDYQLIQEDENQVVLFHEFLKQYFVIAHQDQFIFGIENLDDSHQIESIMKQFSIALQDG